MKGIIAVLGVTIYCTAAEHNPFHFEIYDDVVNPILSLNSASGILWMQ